MSGRALLTNVIGKGKRYLERFGVEIFKGTAQKAKVQQILEKAPVTPKQFVQFESCLKRGVVQNVWRTVVPKFYFNGVASQVSRQAYRRGTGLLLAFNAGLVMTKTNEEEITDFIQHQVKMPETNTSIFSKMMPVHPVTLDNLEIGRHIGQGCNAAVYEARLIHHTLDTDNESEKCVSDTELQSPSGEVSDVSDTDSDITVLSTSTEEEEAPDTFLVEDQHAVMIDVDYPSDTDSDFSFLDASSSGEDWESDTQLPTLSGGESDVSDTDSDITVLSTSTDEEEAPDTFLVEDQYAVMADVDYPTDTDSDLSFVDTSSSDEDWDTDSESDLWTLDAVYGGSLRASVSSVCDSPGNDSLRYQSLDSINSADSEYELAVKMMFNYGVDSNTDAIHSAMACEGVPAMLAQSHQQLNMWQNGHKARKKQLPPHPNIVEMWGAFVDRVPSLPNCLFNHPAALPTSLHQDGGRRNKTLFLIMNKYNSTLKEYISSVVSLGFRERLYLLAQLLEGVAHMSQHEIAHRDLKTNNILLDTHTDGPPRLVISDFGCCLADTRNGLRIPYHTDQIDRGGNTALMAPEIATAEPGLFSYLDYRNSDLWGTGAMAYEILGADNPFYTTPNKGRLDSRTYRHEQLPPLPKELPEALRKLVYNLLERNPSKRVTPRQAADILQLLLWAPADWLLPGNQVTRSEVTWWVITMATQVHFDLQGQRSRSPISDLRSRSSVPEERYSRTTTQLKKCFLNGFNFNRLNQAFQFCGVEIVSKN